jgi:hypothetical protein
MPELFLVLKRKEPDLMFIDFSEGSSITMKLCPACWHRFDKSVINTEDYPGITKTGPLSVCAYQNILSN